eukprot:7544912-Alexandrium_andersonii.AAC.1
MPSRTPMRPAAGSSSRCSTYFGSRAPALLKPSCTQARHLEQPAKCAMGWRAAPEPEARLRPADATSPSVAGLCAGYPAPGAGGPEASPAA